MHIDTIPEALYGHRARSLVLREEHGWKMSEKKCCGECMYRTERTNRG